ncbi:DUF7601 domain-containing protein [Carnobacterium divergens]|uniref:DUF7601 domain-containing protein n=1 Tax=Carnobacterium divergens TaxID=2748 RepID=UPI00288D6B97|nr:FctA domain-containing protein [Carnobacterium divergens]MDT2012593.1 DUF5979 domain-containing protein [Carnobacterium divergens]
MNKTLAKILTFSAVLGFGVLATIPAFAADSATPEPSVVLTKTLVTPDKTVVTMPSVFNFEFEVMEDSFTPHGATMPDSSVTVPDITDKVVSFKPVADLGSTVDGTTTTYKQTGNLLEGITFPEAGVYKYSITEKAGTYVVDPTTEELVYSAANYTLYVYVSRDVDGNPIVDGGTVEDGNGNKVDPAPSSPSTGGGDNEVEEANGFNFTNIYRKQAGSITPPDPGKPDAGLIVSKTITGDLSNAADEFTYSFLLEDTPLVSGEIYVLSTPTGDINIIPGTTATFTLKGGEQALLLNVPAGSKFRVVETDFGYYTPSNDLELNGVASASESNVVAGGILGENSNRTDYINNWETTTPTGIILNNLPYVILIVVALTGFGAYIVNKRYHRS